MRSLKDERAPDSLRAYKPQAPSQQQEADEVADADVDSLVRKFENLVKEGRLDHIRNPSSNGGAAEAQESDEMSAFNDATSGSVQPSVMERDELLVMVKDLMEKHRKSEETEEQLRYQLEIEQAKQRDLA